ncbi:hypothetical protein SAMN02745165_01897 [Malonomonas rubra DSM 5091]|uniref:Uncharacterized protein n=1 Tax=Malonomonas rubra DSM 5091 TaxID=1122189 RepID=A0A1M6HNH4_MALRU|nr:hypothetical protein [Malonomonas rubra]SHJ23693.1 hypothetical protein SAMN02745165_01897 [Malonomonas rubra DSM 5091]
MLESVKGYETPDLSDAENSLSYCVDRLYFVSDGICCEAITEKGEQGLAHIVRDVCDELEAIKELIKNSR